MKFIIVDSTSIFNPSYKMINADDFGNITSFFSGSDMQTILDMIEPNEKIYTWNAEDADLLKLQASTYNVDLKNVIPCLSNLKVDNYSISNITLMDFTKAIDPEVVDLEEFNLEDERFIEANYLRAIVISDKSLQRIIDKSKLPDLAKFSMFKNDLYKAKQFASSCKNGNFDFTVSYDENTDTIKLNVKPFFATI